MPDERIYSWTGFSGPAGYQPTSEPWTAISMLRISTSFAADPGRRQSSLSNQIRPCSWYRSSVPLLDVRSVQNPGCARTGSNREDLSDRLKRGAYLARPARRAYLSEG
jgi:hypothetical protein